MPLIASNNIRIIAILEAAKGALVLLAGFGLLEFVHRGTQQMAEEIVRHFHLNPGNRIPRIFVEFFSNSNDTTLLLLACAAFLYASLRLFEAYGLWYHQRWAEWFGAVSGALYIPIEIYELVHKANWATVMLLFVNTACVVFLVHALRSKNAAPAD